MRKGIVLAGGRNTRLYPTTLAVSKQLLPIYDKPLIYYPLSTVMLSGIKDILLIVRPDHRSGFEKLLGDGSQWGIALEYAEQSEARGIADSLIVGSHFLNGGPSMLVLGDNIFYGAGFSGALQQAAARIDGATVFAYRVNDPHRFGIVEFDEDGRAISLEEKPAAPRSAYAITGLYYFDGRAIEWAADVVPSERGEVEITDVLQRYLDEGELTVERLPRGFAWLDTGLPEAVMQASTFVQTLETRQTVRIACVEEVAYRMGFIDAEQLRAQGELLKSSSYGRYLLQLADEDLR